MRRLTAWIAGTAAGIAAYRLLKRRPDPAAEAVAEPEPTEPDDRPDELRAKLAESRTREPAVEEAVTEPQVDEPEPETPEDRRQRVHEEGRATLDEMKPE